MKQKREQAQKSPKQLGKINITNPKVAENINPSLKGEFFNSAPTYPLGCTFRFPNPPNAGTQSFPTLSGEWRPLKGLLKIFQLWKGQF
jgi:hypothetical protein